MSYLETVAFDFFKLAIFSIFILLTGALVARNAMKIATRIRNINIITKRIFLDTLLEILFVQISSIISLCLLNTAANLYLEKDDFLGIGTFFVEGVQAMATDKVSVALLFLLCGIVIPWVVKTVKSFAANDNSTQLCFTLFGIVVISGCTTVIFSYITPFGADALIKTVYEENPLFGAVIVGGTFFVMFDNAFAKPLKEASETKVEEEKYHE